MDLTSRAQWLAAGFSADELRALVREGRLTPVRRGSYVHGGLPEDVLARHILQVRAAVGELASDAVVSHVSAAVLHGLRIWGVRLDRVHVTRRRRTGGRCGILVHVHSAALDPAEIVMIGGLPVTSLARTVADLGRMLPFEQAVVFGDSAMFHKRPDRVDQSDVLEVLDHEPRRPGTKAARRMLGFSTSLSESVGESRSRVAIAAAGLPPPVLQWEVHAAATGAFVGRVDMGWPKHRTVGEFDGLVKYGRSLRPGQDIAEVLVEEKIREDAPGCGALDLEGPEELRPHGRSHPVPLPRSLTTSHTVDGLHTRPALCEVSLGCVKSLVRGRSLRLPRPLPGPPGSR